MLVSWAGPWKTCCEWGLVGITLRLRLAWVGGYNSPLPTPRPSLAPLGERREPHLAACAALACTHERSLGFPQKKRCALLLLRIFVPALVSPQPVGLGRGAQRKMDQGERLSERSEFELDPIFGEHRRLPRSAAQGTRTIGSPFFCLLFFGETKKSELPPGNPRPTGAGKLTHPQAPGKPAKKSSL